MAKFSNASNARTDLYQNHAGTIYIVWPHMSFPVGVCKELGMSWANIIVTVSAFVIVYT